MQERPIKEQCYITEIQLEKNDTKDHFVHVQNIHSGQQKKLHVQNVWVDNYRWGHNNFQLDCSNQVAGENHEELILL